jgi:uncharacterized protein YggE
VKEILMLRIVLALLIAGLFTPAFAQTATPSVTVMGEATVTTAPDIALIDAGVTSDGKTAKQASEANNKAMGDVLLALKGAGVDQKDFQTSQLSLQPQMSQSASGNGPLKITGYRASNRVTITLRDVANVGGIIDALVGAGANDIGEISFSVSQASKLLDDARVKAVEDARRKAALYAQATGMILGSPLSISEDGAPPPMVFRKMSASPAAAPIAPGEQMLRIAVNIVYELKPKSP